MDRNKIIMVGAAIAVMFLGLLGAYYLTSKPQKTSFSELQKVNAGDQTKWSSDNKLLLVEYSDFQCPACLAYSGLLNDLEKDKEFTSSIQNKITYVYRHFPLDSIHKNARLAAQAAEAAGKQKAFFPMHDLLYANQNNWSESTDALKLFILYAKELKLNTSQFEKDITSPEIKTKVSNDYNSGVQFGIRGTPTFFLNGNLMKNPSTVEEFKGVLKRELQK